jgi:hypothetical protein
MSVLFNHGIRYQVCSANPIRLVRQSAKRRKIPVVLSISEVQQLLDALALREWILVLLDVGTGFQPPCRRGFSPMPLKRHKAAIIRG